MADIQSPAENQALAFLQPFFDQLDSLDIPPIGGQISAGSFQITPTTVTGQGPLTLSAPLVELDESEPCEDAIVAQVGFASVTITGQWNLSVSILDFDGSFVVTVTNISADVLVSLLNPVIPEVMMTTLFDRSVESVEIDNLQFGMTDIQFVGDTLGDDLASQFVPLLQNIVLGQIITAVTNILDDAAVQLEPVFVALPVPVKIQVDP